MDLYPPPRTTSALHSKAVNGVQPQVLAPTNTKNINTVTTSDSQQSASPLEICRAIEKLNNVSNQLFIESRTIMDLYQDFRNCQDAVMRAEKMLNVTSQWETIMFMCQSLQTTIPTYKQDIHPYVQAFIGLVLSSFVPQSYKCSTYTHRCILIDPF
jgi:hypothetical protein